MDHVCTQCGRRQPASARCTGCGDDNLLDLGKEQTRELLLDIDQRLRDRREAQLRIVAVVIGIGFIALLWTAPGYWHARGRVYPGLPFLLDQWVFMIVAAYGTLKLLTRVAAAKPRFPFIDGTGKLTD